MLVQTGLVELLVGGGGGGARFNAGVDLIYCTPGGMGSAGTSYAGGSGGGGSMSSKSYVLTGTNAPSNDGGPGGRTYSRDNEEFFAAGNPGGGCGGLLIVYASFLDGNGLFSSLGGIGNQGGYFYGGSSGGGSVNIFYNEIIEGSNIKYDAYGTWNNDLGVRNGELDIYKFSNRNKI